MPMTGFLPNPTIPPMTTSFGITGSLDPGKRPRSAVGSGLLLPEVKRRRVDAGPGFSVGGNLYAGGAPESYPHPAMTFGFQRRSQLGMFESQPLVASAQRPGPLINPSIPGIEFHLRKLDGSYEVPHNQDLAIMRNNDNNIEQNIYLNPLTGTIMDSTPRMGFTLPGFNWYFALQQERPTSMADLYGESAKSKYATAESALRGFNITGVVNSENGEDNQSTVRRTNFEVVEQVDKKVNIIMQGRTFSMFNMFAGKRLEAGTPVYLLCKRVYRKHKSYVINTYSSSAHHYSDDNHSAVPWQLIPYADNKKPRPGPEDLVGVDDFGNEVMGKALLLGFVHKTAYRVPGVDVDEIPFNLGMIRGQNFIDILLN